MPAMRRVLASWALTLREVSAALLLVVCFASSNAIVAAQDYDVSDIRCTFATSGGSRDSISAKLRKPEGFRGSPLFADDRAVDPVSDKECQIRPDPGDTTKLMYTLLVSDFSRCGVLRRNGFVHVRVWFPQFPGVVMMSDQELIIMCKPPEPTIIENKAAGFAGSFPHGARVSGVVEETPGRLEYEVALYKEAPTRVGAQGQLPPGLAGELPVDQAVPIGTKLQLRARINPDSAWKFLKLMEVTVSPDPDDAHMLGSVALVADGCRNRDFASIIPHQPARYRDRHNEVFLDFEAFLLSTMRERSTLWIHSQIKACMDAADCQADYCLDLFEPAGHGRRRRQTGGGDGFNALNGTTVLLGHRAGRIGPPPPGAHRQARGRGLRAAHPEDEDEHLPEAQALTQRFHNNASHNGHNGGLQQFAKFDENIEYSVLMPGGSPCLSFDIIKDNLGDNREEFPHTAFIVGGTQSPKKGDNCLLVIKMSNLVKTQRECKDEDDDSSESEDEETNEGSRPIMHFSILKHLGCVNRVRSTEVNGTVLAASWSELARVSIWNLNQSIKDVEQNKQLPKKVKREGYGKMANTVPPLFTFTGHQTEGYGLDWSPTMPGVLATGDCTRHIHIWTPSDNLSEWKVDQRPLVGHTDSVEDLQWSPNEPHVLASCSVDKSIRIWDTRAAPNKANQLTVAGAHLSDVNVISWNKKEPLIVSGGDDGFLHIWDLRQFKAGASVATFKHHTEPVTTVEWHPTEPTVFASGGADNQIALWDLSVERDSDATQGEDLQDIPPQLLFIHQGQKDVKELHWHPQITSSIISTAQNGFNVFRTISV